ncbi:TatD family hydrolase [Runella sp. SP2]|uniref:TatD family hydrolase n=1 Tax=Runella sp. SP2 TaxID=2268026 RepID=UPI0013DDC24D|nr:TatD family hydrolase [Runella sp. SP2]
MSELPAERSILNILGQDMAAYGFDPGRWVSVGIHPWYIDVETWETQLVELERWATQPEVKMIGECGLDRLIPLSLEIQLKVFEAQVQVAERVQKPVVIHCVRAFNELLQWHKRRRTQVPLIIHGFNNQPQIAQQLLQKGFYFSLGGALLRPDSNASTLVREIPLERLFLENDDRPIPIEEVYQAAATHLQCSTGYLQSQIWTNFVALFSQK